MNRYDEDLMMISSNSIYICIICSADQHMFLRGWDSSTESVDFLVRRARGSEFDPQHLHEMPGMVALTCNSRAEAREAQIPEFSGQLASLA